MPVVLAPGWAASCSTRPSAIPSSPTPDKEAASVYRGPTGRAVRERVVNGVDDATIPNGWGSFEFDDEGEPRSRTVLFVEGVLQGFLYTGCVPPETGVRLGPATADASPTHTRPSRA